MLGSMFLFFEYRFTILPVLLTIPVFLLLGWLILHDSDNALKCAIVDQQGMLNNCYFKISPLSMKRLRAGIQIIIKVTITLAS